MSDIPTTHPWGLIWAGVFLMLCALVSQAQAADSAHVSTETSVLPVVLATAAVAWAVHRCLRARGL